MSGKVIIDDKDVTGQTIYDFNGKIGTVFQNPRSQFFNVDTTSEIAFWVRKLWYRTTGNIKTNRTSHWRNENPKSYGT